MALEAEMNNVLPPPASSRGRLYFRQRSSTPSSSSSVSSTTSSSTSTSRRLRPVGSHQSMILNEEESRTSLPLDTDLEAQQQDHEDYDAEDRNSTVPLLDNAASNENGENEGDDENGNDDDDEEADSEAQVTRSLAQLEEEREMARRRALMFFMIGLFLLFRLWVGAVESGDYGLVFLCLIGTLWTLKWMYYSREREDDLDRRIARYVASSQPGADSGAEFDEEDLRMLSFEAQLVLAVMESQHQMMMGGHGHPDGPQGTQGVSEQVREQWERFLYSSGSRKSPSSSPCSSPPVTPTRRCNGRSFFSALTSGGSGSKSTTSTKKRLGNKKKLDTDEKDQEGPQCSICLCEYEAGESVVRLPCRHMYHDACLASWTQNHSTCPLCNHQLDDDDDNKTKHQQQQQSSGGDVVETSASSSAWSFLGRPW